VKTIKLLLYGRRKKRKKNCFSIEIKEKKADIIKIVQM
jgi:hypothetical protein